MKQAGCGLRLPWLAYAALMGHHDILSTDPVIDDMDKMQIDASYIVEMWNAILSLPKELKENDIDINKLDFEQSIIQNAKKFSSSNWPLNSIFVANMYACSIENRQVALSETIRKTKERCEVRTAQLKKKREKIEVALESNCHKETIGK